MLFGHVILMALHLVRQRWVVVQQTVVSDLECRAILNFHFEYMYKDVDDEVWTVKVQCVPI